MPPLLNTHTLHSNILLTHAMWTHKLFAHIYIIHTCYADTCILFACAHTSHAHYGHAACTHTLPVHTHTAHTHGSAHTHYIPLAPTATTLRLPGSLQLPRLEGDSSSSLFLPSSRAQAPTPSFPSGRPRCGEGGERETKPFSKNHPFPSIPSRTLLGCPRTSQLTLSVPYL